MQVAVARELLVGFMGQWPVVGAVVKALKLQAKHDVAATALMRAGNGEVCSRGKRQGSQRREARVGVQRGAARGVARGAGQRGVKGGRSGCGSQRREASGRGRVGEACRQIHLEPRVVIPLLCHFVYHIFRCHGPYLVSLDCWPACRTSASCLR